VFVSLCYGCTFVASPLCSKSRGAIFYICAFEPFCTGRPAQAYLPSSIHTNNPIYCLKYDLILPMWTAAKGAGKSRKIQAKTAQAENVQAMNKPL
jgi:hypothetical protein